MCIANVNNDGVYSANVGEGSEISLNIQVEDEMVMMVEVTDVNADEDGGGMVVGAEQQIYNVSPAINMDIMLLSIHDRISPKKSCFYP